MTRLCKEAAVAGLETLVALVAFVGHALTWRGDGRSRRHQDGREAAEAAGIAAAEAAGVADEPVEKSFTKRSA